MEGAVTEMVEHDIVRRVVCCADLLQDDVLFAFEFLGVKHRIGDDVGKNVHGKRDIVLEHTGKEGRAFRACCGIDLAADIFDLDGDLLRTAARCAFESHMLKQVSHAVLVFPLVSRACPEPEADRYALDAIEPLGRDRDAVGQPVDSHALQILPPKPVFASAAVRRGSFPR